VDIVPIPLLSDNYGYLLIDPATKRAAIVDCSEAGPVLAEVERRGLTLEAILSTHHHFDHVGGNDEAARVIPGIRVLGSAADRARVPAITEGLADGEEFEVIGVRGRAILIPAHTSGHLAYFFPTEGPSVFSGDTLFAAGCGRLFEGSPAQMMDSLGKLAALPDSTRVWCGHEYTEKNLAFAHELEPTNPDIAAKLDRVRNERRQGRPTVPSTIGEEKRTNPFLRSESAELRRSIQAKYPGLPTDSVSVFAKTRELKDNF
jgi:hydroxyacylglutathione hydrolase